MSLWSPLKRLWTKKVVEGDGPYSIVLLLRQPHFFSADELKMAGERGFGIPFDGKADSSHFVAQQGWTTLIKAGNRGLKVIHASHPYVKNKREIAHQLPQQGQQKAWLKHNAWVGFEILNPEIAGQDAYEALARFVLHLRDANCTGLWLPKHSLLVANDGAADDTLHRLVNREEIF